MTTSVGEKIQEMLDKTCEINNWDPSYVEEYTLQAATKASAYFQALGYDYGDRIPGVYKLNDTIKELVATLGEDMDKNKEISWASSGMFRVSRIWDESCEGWELNIALELQDIYEHRITDATK